MSPVTTAAAGGIPAAIAAAKELIEIADKLDILREVKIRLILQSDEAAAQLAAVLDEISKIYGALDGELGSYLSLSFYDQMSPREEAEARRILSGLEGGAAGIRVAEARGHSSKISNIHARLLRPWFGKVLRPDEQRTMEELFRSLDEFDGVMIRAMSGLTDWLKDRAGETNRLLLSGDMKAANRSIIDASRDVLELRLALTQAIVSLRNLQADFIRAAVITSRP
jgi:hypothetical protein